MKTPTKIKNPAALWKRAIAYLIDVLIINAFLIIPFNKALEGYSTSLFELKTPDPAIIQAVIAIVIINLLYWIILEYKVQQTLGKLLLNIFVTSKKKPTIKQIIMRNIIKPFTILFFIDVRYLLIKRNNQRLFEVFSNTWVIEK